MIKIRCSSIKSYNCALGTMDHLQVTTQTGQYFDKDKIPREELVEATKEFFNWLKDPTPAGTGTFSKELAFFVFHDNILGEGKAPLYDMSSFLRWCYENQEELGCHVTQTPAADNLWHGKNLSHPGRVYILIPPHVQVMKKGVNLSEFYKNGLKGVLMYSKGCHKDDLKLMKSLVG